MRTKILGFLYLYRQVGIRSLCNIIKPICPTGSLREILKLVHIPPGLEPKMLKQPEICILAEY